MPLLPFLASEQGPPWLPAAAAESRKLVYWAQLGLLVIGVIGILYGIVNLAWWGFHGLWGFYYIIGGVVDLLLVFMLNESFFKPLDAGRFKEASDKLLIWLILGLVFLILGGLILLFAYMKLQEVFQPQYQPYPTGQYQGAPPQQPPAGQAAPPPQAPPAQPAPPAPQPTSEEHKKAEMVKCKKCGVMYPAFMRTCPNCNEPR
jgi:hypothetical protein